MPAFFPNSAFGAERIVLSYGILERSLSIDALEAYAKTGKVDRDLAVYVQYADSKQLTRLRQVLLTRIPLNAVEVSQFLYTPIGERLLERLGEVIQPGSGQAGSRAIRAALILAAVDPQGFTPLNVLRKFPTTEIEIDLAQSLEIAAALETLVNQTQQAVALVNQQSTLEANTAPPTNLFSNNLQLPGRFSWKKQTITLNDRSRDRTFPTDIYLPQPLTRHPVIVISHGLGSDRLSFAYLAEHLASYGFVVAVPEHPGSSASQLQALLAGRASDITSPREFIDRPLDIRFLLDELSRLSRSDSELHGHLNLQQVGVIGQSFGGYTALALAGAAIRSQSLLQADCRAANDSLNLSLLLQCLALRLPKLEYDLSDPRVKAAIAINPIDSSILGQESLSQIKIPVMIVASSADTVAPVLPEQIRPFTWLTTPNKYLVLINGGTHFSTIAETPNAAVPIPDPVIGPSPVLARRYVEVLSVAFLKTYVANQANYRSYLSAAYTRTISREPLSLSLVRSLPSDQLTYGINNRPDPR